MKNGRITIIGMVLIAIALLTAFSQVQDDSSKSTIIVKATASLNKNVSFIRIYRDNSEVEKIELARLTGGMEAEENNFKAIVTTLNKLNQEGYEVISSTELGMANGNVSTFVMRK